MPISTIEATMATIPLDAISIRHVGYLTNNSAFRYMGSRPPQYVMSVLLPKPTVANQFVSFDVYTYQPNSGDGRYYQLVLSGGNKSAIRMKVDSKNTVHALPGAALEGRGLGSLGYYVAAFLNQIFDGRQFIQSDIPTRSPEASNWWDPKVAAGVARREKKTDYLDARVAADKLYIWRTGSVPRWAPDIENLVILDIHPRLASIIQNNANQSPLKSEVQAMLRNVYPAKAELAAAAAAQGGPLNGLRGILSRRPVAGIQPSQLWAYDD